MPERGGQPCNLAVWNYENRASHVWALLHSQVRFPLGSGLELAKNPDTTQPNNCLT